VPKFTGPFAECRPEDAEPGTLFYASMISCNGSQFALIFGPYQTHEEAEAKARRACEVVAHYDPQAPWYAYGTCGLRPGTEPPPPAVFTDGGELNPEWLAATRVKGC
jgi:hypothetical protein